MERSAKLISILMDRIFTAQIAQKVKCIDVHSNAVSLGVEKQHKEFYSKKLT